MRIKTKKIKKALPLLAVPFVALVIVIVAFLYFNNVSRDLADNSSASNNKPNTSSSDISQGGAVDNHGILSTQDNNSEDDWAVSDSGLITLKTPVALSTLESGEEFNGVSSLKQVQYRLVDDDFGVIAQGSLDVVGGRFSGSLRFQPKAKSGRLIVYSFDDQGREVNRVQIEVAFKV